MLMLKFCTSKRTQVQTPNPPATPRGKDQQRRRLEGQGGRDRAGCDGGHRFRRRRRPRLGMAIRQGLNKERRKGVSLDESGALPRERWRRGLMS